MLGVSGTLEWEHLIYDRLPAACCKQVEYGQSCRSQHFWARSTVAARAVSNDCLVLRKQRPKLEGWWWSAGLAVDHQSSVKGETGQAALEGVLADRVQDHVRSLATGNLH